LKNTATSKRVWTSTVAPVTTVPSKNRFVFRILTALVSISCMRATWQLNIVRVSSQASASVSRSGGPGSDQSSFIPGRLEDVFKPWDRQVVSPARVRGVYTHRDIRIYSIRCLRIVNTAPDRYRCWKG
jgi:hypothetical protein